MGGATRLLVNSWSLEVYNLLDFLKYWVADCHKFSISRLMLRPQSGSVAPMKIVVLVPLFLALSLESGVKYLLITLSIVLDIGMDISTPLLMIHWSVLIVHTLPDVASAKISFTAGVSSVCGVSLNVVFLGGGTTKNYLMVRQLNNLWSRIPLLVWVTVSRLLVRSTCASLAVALFNSYPALFIVKILIALSSLSDLSSFSLVKIASTFSLCKLDAWLNTSAVTLLVSVIDSSSSYITTFKIAPQIFTLDNGLLLLYSLVI